MRTSSCINLIHEPKSIIRHYLSWSGRLLQDGDYLFLVLFKGGSATLRKADQDVGYDNYVGAGLASAGDKE